MAKKQQAHNKNLVSVSEPLHEVYPKWQGDFITQYLDDVLKIHDYF